LDKGRGEIRLFGTGDDFVLKGLGQVAEVIAVARNPDDQIAMLLRMQLCFTKSGRVHNVELDVMAAELEIGAHQMSEVIDAILALHDRGGEFLIEQGAARAGM